MAPGHSAFGQLSFGSVISGARAEQAVHQGVESVWNNNTAHFMAAREARKGSKG